MSYRTLSGLFPTHCFGCHSECLAVWRNGWAHQDSNRLCWSLEGMDQLLQRWRCPGLSHVHIRNLGSSLLHDVYSSLPFMNSLYISKGNLTAWRSMVAHSGQREPINQRTSIIRGFEGAACWSPHMTRLLTIRRQRWATLTSSTRTDQWPRACSNLLSIVVACYGSELLKGMHGSGAIALHVEHKRWPKDEATVSLNYSIAMNSMLWWTGNDCIQLGHNIYNFLHQGSHVVPVVPHKAVVEVSKIGNYRRGELLWCMDGRANPLMDRKVVVIFRVVAVVTSPTTAGCNAVKRSAIQL